MPKFSVKLHQVVEIEGRKVDCIFWSWFFWIGKRLKTAYATFLDSGTPKQAPIAFKYGCTIHTICLYSINKSKTWDLIFVQQYELRFWIGNLLFYTKHGKYKNPTIWSESPLLHIICLTLLLETILERFFSKSRYSDSSMWLKSGSEILSFSASVEWLQNNKFPFQKSTTWWPELTHFQQKCIPINTIANTLLEMMVLITLCDFEIFQFSHENSKFPIQKQAESCCQNGKINRN